MLQTQNQGPRGPPAKAEREDWGRRVSLLCLFSDGEDFPHWTENLGFQAKTQGQPTALAVRSAQRSWVVVSALVGAVVNYMGYGGLLPPPAPSTLC